MAHVEHQNSFWVAEWRVQPGLSEIEKNGTVIQLEPKVMAVLELLASRPGPTWEDLMRQTGSWKNYYILLQVLL